MSHSRLVFLAATLLVIVIAWGCSTPPQPSPEEVAARDLSMVIVAEFGPDFSMTAQELYDKMYATRMFVPRGGVVDDSLAQDFLDSLMIDTLVGLDSKNVDLSKYWAPYRSFKIQRNDLLMRTFWDREAFGAVSADTAEILQFFQDSAHFFSVDEQVDMQHILCSPKGFLVGPDSLLVKDLTSEEQLALAKEFCDKCYQMLEYGEDFWDVAYDYSHDGESRKRGGQVGWTRRGVYLDPFDSIAFSLGLEEYSKPYQDRDGYHIVKVVGHIDSGLVPIDSPGVFESATRTLLTVKGNDRLSELLDSLRPLLSYETNPAVIDTNIYYVENDVWAAIVNNGRDTVDVRRLKSLEEAFRRKYEVDSTTAEIRAEMINAAAEPYLVVQASRDRGYDTLPKVSDQIKLMGHYKRRQIVLRDKYGPDWSVTDTAMQKYYQGHLDYFSPPKPLTVEHLTVKDSALAAFLHEQAITGLDLKDLASDYGKDQGYEVEYRNPGKIGQEDISPEYFRAAQRAGEGDIGSLLRTDEGFQIIRVHEKLRQRSYVSAAGEIRSILRRQYRREQWEIFRDKLYDDYGARFPEKLGPVVLPDIVARTQAQDAAN